MKEPITIGFSRKAEKSLGYGFHSIPKDWHKIDTPSRQKSKKTKELEDGDEVLVLDSQVGEMVNERNEGTEVLMEDVRLRSPRRHVEAKEVFCTLSSPSQVPSAVLVEECVKDVPMSFEALVTPPSKNRRYLWSDVPKEEESSSDDGKASTDLPCQLVSSGSIEVDDKGTTQKLDLGKRVS